MLLLGVAAFSSLLVGGAVFPYTFFGKVMLSLSSLFAGTAPSLPPWRLPLSPFPFCSLPPSWAGAALGHRRLIYRFDSFLPLCFHVCVLFSCDLSCSFFVLSFHLYFHAFHSVSLLFFIFSS